MRESVIKLGENRGKPRVWIEGKWLTDNGFAPGSQISVNFTKGELTIKTDPDGDRKVSTRGKKRAGGIIDINTEKLSDVFTAGTALKVVAEKGVITITPSKTKLKQIARKLTSIAVGLFVGGGLLCSAAEAAGFQTAAAVEVDPDFAEIWDSNHTGMMYEEPIEEVDFAEMAKRIDGPVGLLTAGRPCEPYSNIRRLDRGGQQKRDKSLPPEAHELGHLDYFVLNAVDHLNPHTVIIENVPGYLDAGSGYQVIGVLKAFGYTVEAKVLNALDYGCITARQRAVIVATTFDTVRWPDTVTQTLKAGDILEEIPHDSELWFGEDHWAPQHWKKQSAKGNGFAAPAVTAEHTSIPTLKKRYYAGQGDNFVIAHPVKPNTWRWLTLTEGRRLMGVPDTYDLGPTKTTAGEVLGQGVAVPMFTRLIQALVTSEEA